MLRVVDVKKTIVNTTFGPYTIYFPNGDQGAVEIYRGTRGSFFQIGDLLIGSLDQPPSTGVQCDNYEYLVRDNSKTAFTIRREASKNVATVLLNYMVIRDVKGNLRILPQTKQVEEGLTKRITAAERANGSVQP